jgi:YVTN family beta-propeller protein
VARPLVSDLRRGSEIAGYRVEALLGRGGMGVVYLAEDLALGRNVALKLLAPELAEDARFRERFLSESRLAASIDHSHIVPIYEAGEAEGRLFIAMRYVEGTDLATVLALESPVAPERALAIIEQVADALDAAHQRGLVHRDVKPANILVTSEGGREHCYLVDFGLSRQVAHDAGPADLGHLSGTPDYVAPEQIEGGPLSSRADVYALGCVLYECLTGSAPFKRDSPLAVLWAHVADDPPPPSTLNPSLPTEIDDVLARALEKEPEQRYASCREIVEDARAELGLPDEAGLVAFVRRRAPLLLALAGLLLIGVAVLAFLLVRGGPSPPVSPQVDSLARIDPQTNAVAATIPVGASPTAVAAGERWVWAANFDDETVTQVDSESNTVARTIVIDGSPIAIAVGEGAVWVTSTRDGDTVLTKIDAESAAVRRELELGTGLTLLAVGGGSVWLAVGDITEDTVLRLLPGTGAVEERIPLPSRAGAVAFGAGALWVASAGLDGLVWRIDPATNEIAASIPLDFRAEDIAVVDGVVWVTNRGANSVSRIDPATDRVAETIPVGRGAVGIAADEGAVWVANSADRTVSRLDARTGDVVTTIGVDARLGDVSVGAGGVWVTAEAD